MTRSIALLGLTVGVLALGLELELRGLLIIGYGLILVTVYSMSIRIMTALHEWNRGRHMPRDDHPDITATLYGVPARYHDTINRNIRH